MSQTRSATQSDCPQQPQVSMGMDERYNTTANNQSQNVPVSILRQGFAPQYISGYTRTVNADNTNQVDVSNAVKTTISAPGRQQNPDWVTEHVPLQMYSQETGSTTQNMYQTQGYLQGGQYMPGQQYLLDPTESSPQGIIMYPPMMYPQGMQTMEQIPCRNDILQQQLMAANLQSYGNLNPVFYGQPENNSGLYAKPSPLTRQKKAKKLFCPCATIIDT